MSRLFSPWSLQDLQLPNRIVVAPMCQYSAVEGSATDWHVIHLGHLALSGAGLLILEATAVSPQGRITAGCLGLYNDANEAALARALDPVRAHSPIALAIQLAHAGRKGSSQVRGTAASRSALSNRTAGRPKPRRPCRTAKAKTRRWRSTSTA